MFRKTWTGSVGIQKGELAGIESMPHAQIFDDLCSISSNGKGGIRRRWSDAKCLWSKDFFTTNRQQSQARAKPSPKNVKPTASEIEMMPETLRRKLFTQAEHRQFFRRASGDSLGAALDTQSQKDLLPDDDPIVRASKGSTVLDIRISPPQPSVSRTKVKAGLLFGNSKYAHPLTPPITPPQESARFYDDPTTRLKLKVFTNSALRFDEALEYGFPCISSENVENVKNCLRHSRRDIAESFDGHHPSVTRSGSGTMKRNMTLRLTLTPKEARANEDAIYGASPSENRRNRFWGRWSR